jgi:hypothetical protein
VLASLWSVSDSATTALMEHFYSHWLDDGRADETLVPARQRHFAARRTTSAPTQDIPPGPIRCTGPGFSWPVPTERRWVLAASVERGPARAAAERIGAIAA